MWGVADKKQNALEKYVKKTEMEISVMGKNEAWKGKGKQYNFKYNGKDVFTKKRVRGKKNMQLSMKRKFQNEEERVAKLQAVYRLICPEE